MQGNIRSFDGQYLGPSPQWAFMVVGLGAILGHTFSMWIGFKGGKAVATSVVSCYYIASMFLAAVIAFISSILLTSMVSMVQCLALLSLPYYQHFGCMIGY